MKEFIKITQPIGFIIIGIIVFSLPLFIQSILWGEHILPFDFSTIDNPETWFSFIGSYLGAIGAVALGVMTLLQAQKYNESSQEFVVRQQELLENIKKLNEQQNYNLTKHKYHDIYVDYSEKLEKYQDILINNNPTWAYTHMTEYTLKTNEEVVAKRNILMALASTDSKLTDFLSWFIGDTFFFEGKENLYTSVEAYKILLNQKICEIKSLNPLQEYGTEVEKTFQEIGQKYAKLIVNLNTYSREVNSQSKLILLNEISFYRIEKDIKKMKETHALWIMELAQKMI